MIILHILSLLFSTLVLTSSVLVILVSNSVYSVILLILSFINSGFFFLLLNLEFLSFIFVLIYAGAILILFLFIIMMLEIKVSSSYSHSFSFVVLSSFIIIGCTIHLLIGLNSTFLTLADNISVSGFYVHWLVLLTQKANIQVLAALYTDFLPVFFLSSLVLLVAILGSVILLTKPFQNHQVQPLLASPIHSLFYKK